MRLRQKINQECTESTQNNSMLIKASCPTVKFIGLF